MTMSDYDAVMQLWQNTPGIGLSEADSQENILRFLKRNAGLSLLAESGKTVVGAVLCGHDGRRGYIHHLAVKEQYRGHGHGKNLISRCLALLKKEGIGKCHLFVFTDNSSGSKFWEKEGWTQRDELHIFSKTL